MDELEEIKLTFFQECDDLSGDLEAGLLSLQAGHGDDETVNAVFRAVHSIKGGAGAFGMEALVRYAHVFETLLEALRSHKVALSDPLMKDLLVAADILADHVSAARAGGEGDPAATASMVARLEQWIRGDAVAAVAESAPASAVEMVESQAGDALGSTPMPVSSGHLEARLDMPDEEQPWKITFQPASALYANANEAGLLLRELERLGPLQVELLDDALPPLDSLAPEASYLAWTVMLDAPVSEDDIREVFEFVEGDCALTIGRDVTAMPTVPTPLVPLGDIDDQPVVTPLRVELSVVDVEPHPEPEVPAEAPPVAALPPSPPPVRAAAVETPAQATIRVDPERIDRLIDLVGELVINQAMLAQRVAGHGFAPSSDISMGLDELEQLTRQIQDGVMAIRAQPVKSVFQRMPRLVREVASQTGRQVRLVTEGEATEVDKTVIERISEPITHMLRNAIDHGLESPDERIAAGKPPEGVVRLAALHRGGRIVVEVEDDGRGINRPRVRDIAISKGLIAADAVLTDEETDNLIFLPGFSTAAKVSDISGRGVGMDVVRRSVQALGGRISINSRPGKGSIFTLSLPLTLAVLDGMVVDVAGQTMIVPLTAIIESLKPRPEMVKALGPNGAVLAVRNAYVPLLDIGRMLGYRDTDLAPDTGVVLLVENEDGSQSALVADAIRGQRQVVIKSLEANFQRVPGIAAATILGDGRVALILDVDALAVIRQRESRTPEPLLAAE